MTQVLTYGLIFYMNGNSNFRGLIYSPIAEASLTRLGKLDTKVRPFFDLTTEASVPRLK